MHTRALIFLALAGMLACIPATKNAAAQSVLLSPTGNQNVAQPVVGSTQTSLGINVFNGIAYASRFVTGSGNNGISNAFANNQTVVADPAYTGNERHGNLDFPVPTNTTAGHLIDYRLAMQADQFVNWDTSYIPLYPASIFNGAAHSTTCSSSYQPNPIATQGTNCIGTVLNVSAPGWSIGNTRPYPSNNPGAAWAGGNAIATQTLSQASGIFGAAGGAVTHTAPGDTINYFYANSNNGWIAASDEGVKALAAGTNERSTTYTGTLTSGAGTGSMSIKTTPVTDGGFQGQGQYVIDTTVAPISGHVTAVNNGLISLVNALTIDTTVTVSNAWGTLTADVATPLVPNPPFTTSMTFNVNVTSGAFDTTHLVCIASSFHECSIPTAVSTVSPGVQAITIPLRRPHASGGLIMQGGAAGRGIEIVANTVRPGGQSLRYLQDVYGSTDGQTLQASSFAPGGVAGFQYGMLYLSVVNLGTISSTGTTVTATISGGSFYRPQRYTGSTFTISGASDSALNAACSNLAFDTSGHFTCTIAGLTGTHTAPSGSASLGNNAFNLWPMAETLDVQNYTTNPISVDGTLTLEPNIITTHVGDVIEQTHHQAAAYSAFSAFLNVDDPYTNMGGASFSFGGMGIQGPPGGGNCFCFPALASFVNSNPDSWYVGSGGNLGPTNLINMGGRAGAPYVDGIYSYPGPSGSFIEIQPSSKQMADQNYSSLFLLSYSAAGNFQIGVRPYSNSAYFLASRQSLSIYADNGVTLGSGGGTSITLTSPVVANSTLSAASVTDSGLTSGNCVQASTGGLLTTTSGPCIPVNIPLRYVGLITTTTSTADSLAVTGLTTSNHCSAQATNATASSLANYVSITSGTVTLNHPTATAGATFDLFCNLL